MQQCDVLCYCLLSEMLLTTEQVNRYLAGDKAKRGQLLLQQAGMVRPIQVSMSDHTAMRNYMIMELVISNASRASGIINMNIVDVSQAEKHKEHHVIVVSSN